MVLEMISMRPCRMSDLVVYLKNETSLEALLGEEGDGGGDVTAVHADHVRVFIVPEVGNLLLLK